MSGCGAPRQGALAAVDTGTTDTTTETVLTGRVLADGAPVSGAYVRLLNQDGEFTAEVVSSSEGDFRFYAAPGTWTVRALHRSGNGQVLVSPSGPGVHTVEVVVA